MSKVLVFNGWAARPEAWSKCQFAARAKIVDYKEDFDEGGYDVVVGWSMGGAKAIEYAGRHLGDVKAMVLIAPAVCMMAKEGWKGQTPRRIEALRKGLEVMGANEWFNKDDSEEELERGLDYLRSTDVRNINLQVKCICVHSRKDCVVYLNNSEWVRDCWGAKLTVVEGTEHALPVSEPELIDRIVYEAIDE